MSTSITEAFITQYEKEVHLVYQREGAKLKDTVRYKGDVVGSSTTFQKIGTGTATTKARHGTITPMNQTHTAISCSLSDFYAGDWVDKLDEAKINIDERDALARSGAMALGRKVDDQIITTLNATTQTAITVDRTGTAAALRSGIMEWIGTVFANDVPNDGQVYAYVPAMMWSSMLSINQFASADFVGANGLPHTTGIPTGQLFKDWMGIKWCMHTGGTNAGAASATAHIWHKMAVGYGAAKSAGNVAGRGAVAADIQWHNDRAAHFVNHMMSGGSCLIDDTGVIEASFDDSQTPPSS